MHAIEYRNSEQVTLLCSRLLRIVFAEVNGIMECCLGRLSSAVLMIGMSDVCCPSSNGERPGHPLRTMQVSTICFIEYQVTCSVFEGFDRSDQACWLVHDNS